jgi:uncharacterized protein
MKLRTAILVACATVLGACEKSADLAKPAAADPWASHPKAVVAKDPLPHPLFWSLEKDGKTTYILGTMHVGVDAESRLPKLVWAKLDAAPTFAMETNLADASVGSMARGDQGSLHADLGDAYWQKLEAAVTPAQAAMFDHLKPMVAATTLSMRGLPLTEPMDGVLASRAQTEHKAMVYLEPASKEMAILEKWMDVRAVKMLLDDLDTAPAHTNDMLDAYIAGDTAKILALTDSERDDAKKSGYTDAEYDAQMNDLLYERNASWIDAIEQLHARGGGFIAVGAMHLIGERSVLELLAHKGYKVTRLAP